MPALNGLVHQLVLDGLLINQLGIKRQGGVGLGLVALSVLLVFAGSIFLLMALHLWLGNYYPPETALAIAGGAAFFAAAVFASVSYAINQTRKSAVVRAEEKVFQVVSGFIEQIASELDDPIQKNPKIAVALAAVSGMLAGNKLH